MSDSIYDINPSEITEDPQVKRIFLVLLNHINKQDELIASQALEIQSLKDEVNRLKGEQGKPHFKAKGKGQNNNTDISSEKERKVFKQWSKKGKKDKIEIDRSEDCKVDQDDLPNDAYLLTIDRVVMQEIKFERDNVEYFVEVWYSPSQKKTYRAGLPQSYTGQFGSTLGTFIKLMHHSCDVTHRKLHSLLNSLGINISKGTICNKILERADLFIAEKKSILHAGLSCSYHQSDSTAAKVKGDTHATHIICNEFFKTYTTLKSKKRQDILYALQGEPEEGLVYAYNQSAQKLLKEFAVSRKDQKKLQEVLEEGEQFLKDEFVERISRDIPKLAAKKNMFIRVCEAFAIGHYREQKQWPVAKVWITDDAHEYCRIAMLGHGLCWVHDGRHYKKLTPRVKIFQHELDKFSSNYWNYYHKLLSFKKAPTEKLKQKLIEEFDLLFSSTSDYENLNERILKTARKKDALLMVLNYPQIPLHNNLSELAVRRKVQKRDISLHTMSELGTKAQDAYMSIIETAKMHGVNAFEYIKDRVEGKNRFPSLASLIYENSSRRI